MFIWCPNNGDECNKHIIPSPKSCFLMYSTREDTDVIIDVVEEVLEENEITLNVADRRGDSINLFCKICQMIQASSFGIVIFTKETPLPSTANIFYEAGLMHAQGKNIIFIGWGYNISEIPSDLSDLEWILSNNSEDLKTKLNLKISSILDKYQYFLILGQNEEKTKNYEKSIEYYTKAGLLCNNDDKKEEIANNIDSVYNKIKNSDMHPILKRRALDFKNFIKP